MKRLWNWWKGNGEEPEEPKKPAWQDNWSLDWTGEIAKVEPAKAAQLAVRAGVLTGGPHDMHEFECLGKIPTTVVTHTRVTNECDCPDEDCGAGEYEPNIYRLVLDETLHLPSMDDRGRYRYALDEED